MRATRVDNPDTRAEGLCAGLPYTTDVYSSQGCSIHFWIPEHMLLADAKAALALALHKARNARDVVIATWSIGAPTGFWARQDIE